MRTDYQYVLEPGSRKHLCPNCHKKRFVRYIVIHTNEHLPERYGRCDREINCGYHLNPYLDGYGKHNIRQLPIKKEKKKETAFIPSDVLELTLHGYEKNDLLQNLLSSIPFPFEIHDVETVISLYFLGTVCTGYRNGATTFPFIDVNGQIRAIQVKHFNKSNKTTSTDFLHSIIEKLQSRNNKPIPDWLKAYKNNELKISCLFGEHLLKKYPDNPIALVEAPKTAIYGTLYLGFPDNPSNFLWLAVYNLSSLNYEKVKVLKGRDVFLFPDLSKDSSAYNLWDKKGKEYSSLFSNTRFITSDLLEKYATAQQRELGMDIADYLINFDWRQFRRNVPTSLVQDYTQIEQSQEEKFTKIQKKTLESDHEPTLKDLPIDELLDLQVPWDIETLENFFSYHALPDTPISTKSGEIINVQLYVKSHINIVRAQNGKGTYRPYYQRLIDLKEILTTIAIPVQDKNE